MKAYDIIAKKRDGAVLSSEEIGFMVDGYIKGSIPDYQMSAFLMTICTRGMDEDETVNLTKAITSSGRQIDLGSIGMVVDKHSTGGVGDKTTLVLAPLVAAAGAKIAKLSGRSLGHTGGTLDKFESIPGFNVNLTDRELLEQVGKIGVAISSASKDIAPADKKIYALRDVTATVASAPLIASSVMSKKIAGGAGGIVLDVKTGSGAFIKSLEESKKLAQLMVNIGKGLGKKMVAVISNMSQPLGRAVGNSLEVKEAIDVLKSQGPKDVKELCLTLGSHMLVLSEVASTLSEAKGMLEGVISSGAALNKFIQLVRAQGGNSEAVSKTDLLPRARHIVGYKARREGYIQGMDAEKIGQILVSLGGGRIRKDEEIDLSVGLVFHCKCGDRVRKGKPILEIHANDKEKRVLACQVLDESVTLTDRKSKAPSLIYDTIT